MTLVMHCTTVGGFLPHPPFAKATGGKPADPKTLGLQPNLTNQINSPVRLPAIA